MANNNNKYDKIKTYYNDAGDIGYRDFSPHFWLQYAIAARSFKDYKSAERSFAAAQKIAQNKKDFQTYKIDNAYVQFLLESRSETSSWGDYFDAFMAANSLAFKQSKMKAAGLYPFRIVTNYPDYLEVRGSLFTKKQKVDSIEICKSWIGIIDHLPSATKGQRTLVRARAAVSRAYDLMVDLDR